MPKKYFPIVFFVGLFSQVAVSDPNVPKKEPIWKNGQYNLARIETVGNSSWAPLELHGYIEKYRTSIQYLVLQFENANPGLEVTSWYVQGTSGEGNSEFYRFYIEGVWIYHKPKINCVK